jgi:hypothetical protein
MLEQQVELLCTTIVRKWYNSSMADNIPTDAMAGNARRGLELRQKYGRGGTMVGVARARDLANKKNLSDDTVLRMHSFFSRHEVDKQGRGFNAGEPGYPSNGLIAWLLWGGDSGKSWAESKRNAIMRRREQKMFKGTGFDPWDINYKI